MTNTFFGQSSDSHATVQAKSENHTASHRDQQGTDEQVPIKAPTYLPRPQLGVSSAPLLVV